MRARIGQAALIALGLTAAPVLVLGQDLEIIEAETFVDPGILRLEIDDEPIELFGFVSHIRLGGVSRYQYRDRFTRDAVGFVDFMQTYAWRNLHLSLRLTALGGLSEDDGEDSGRFEFQVGRYFERGSGEDRLVHRLQLTGTRQYGRSEGSGRSLGIDWDMSSEGVVGGFSYAKREEGCGEDFGFDLSPPCEPGPPADEHYFSLDVRTLLWSPLETHSVDVGLGLGAAYRDHELIFGAFQIELAYQFRLYRNTRLYLVYSPAYQLEQWTSGQRLNHQVALFLHAPILTKVFLPKKYR